MISLNYDQGWEPMRNDHLKGFMRYDPDEVISDYTKKRPSISKISYKECNGYIVTDVLFNPQEKQAHVIYLLTSKIINYYVPNSISELSQLCDYINSIGILNIKSLIEKV